MYTPVNAYKLSRKSREQFEFIKKLLQTKASRVEINKNLYDEFVEAMPISCREIYRHEFPIGDKVVVRG